MSPLIEINDQAFAHPDTIVIDSRGGKDSYQRYLSGHLNNAIYADLDQHLAAPVSDAVNGGRHPLPDINNFAAQLGSWGITPSSHVIIYDDKSAAMSAARLWWMLRAIGHKKVQVLNGGLSVATKAGVTLSSEIYTPLAVEPYPVVKEYEGAVGIDVVKKASQADDSVVIDVRETPRYLGQTEPIDLVAGHIPGAVNLPYLNNLDADGKYINAADLRRLYDNVLADTPHQKIIVHCGSGVTACHTLLGMAYAGISEPKLYVGSWSEWSRRGLPIATDQL